MILISKAIHSLYPAAEFIIENECIDNIRWIKNKPAEFDFANENEKQTLLNSLIAEVDRLNSIDERLTYQQQRKSEYPSIQEQLDMQYWDKINGTNHWEQAIQAVKQKYPKPE